MRTLLVASFAGMILAASAIQDRAALAQSAAPAPAPVAAPALAAAPTADAAVRWMPQGTQLVLRIRFSDMRTSALFRSLMASKPLFAHEMAPIDRFASDAGIDLGRDVDLAWVGTDGRDRGASVAILTGRLEGGSLGGRLEKKGARPAPYGDLRLYILPSRQGGGAGETVVAFPQAGTALVGSRDWVCIAIDRLQGRGRSVPTALLPLTGRADTAATIWSAAGGRAVSEKVRTEWATGQLGGEDFGGIETLVATFRIAGDLKIDSEAKTSGEDADALELTLKGLIAVSGLRASVSDPSLAEVLRGIRIDRTDAGVRLSTRIPASFASRL